jgi:type IV secretion system protein VirD4
MSEIRIVPKAEVPGRIKRSLLILLGIFAFATLFYGIGEPSGFGIFLAIVSITAFILILKKWKLKQPEEVLPGTNNEHGSARWATMAEFEAAGYGMEGLWIGDGFSRKKSGHLITIAGSGQGKGACIILPNLLIAPFGSYVVTDPKGENACISARWQQQNGQRVFIIDPWNEQEKIAAKHGIPASGFNPFDFIKQDLEELRDNCEQIATFLVPDKPDVKDPYWNDRSRALIKVLLMHIVTACPPDEHNFWTLYKMLRLSGDNWINLLLDMKGNEHLDGLVSIAAEEFMGLDPNGSNFTGIRSSAQNATTIFESPQLRRSLEQSDFNPYDLTDGDCTVYVVIPERFLDTHGTWLRLVIGLCLKACNAKPNKRVNFILDEFAIMGKMKDIQKNYAFARGQNIVLWMFAQSLSQIKELYGEDGMNAFLSNAAVFQCFGVKDQFTKEFVSKALGEATYMKASTSYGESSSSSGGGSSSSTSYSSYGRSLLTPEEVEKCKDIIVLTEGLKFLISKMAYFQNRYVGVPASAEWLDQEARDLIKKGRLPEDWREIFADRADPAPRVYA